jgi:hypothetical protein
MHRGHMSAMATWLTQSGQRRICLCNACDVTFSETRETVFFAWRTSAAQVMMALKMLLVKGGLSDMGLVLGVTEATVLLWLERAAHKAHEMNAHLLRARPVTQVHLDELWSVIRRKPAQQADADGERSNLRADGRQWGWSSFAPEVRRILAAFVGPRTLDSALQRIQMTAAVVIGVPCFCSEGFSG